MYLLGAPIRERLTAYEEAFRKRFFPDEGVGNPPMAEKGVEYIYRDVERQIDKARGLLTYNALLFTAFSVVRSTLTKMQEVQMGETPYARSPSYPLCKQRSLRRKLHEHLPWP
jgi:hypothetical protein